MQFFIKLAEFFYKFTENREFLIGRFLPYKQGIETPVLLAKKSPQKYLLNSLHYKILI